MHTLVQYDTIKDFDAYFNQWQLYYQMTNNFTKKQRTQSETKDPLEEQQKLIQQTISQKNKQKVKEPSFQNKFMDQHIQSFEKSLYKYLKKCYPELENTENQKLIWKIFGEDVQQVHSNEKLNEMIKKDIIYFEQRSKNQFLAQLFYHENLYEFLSYISNNTHSSIAIQLFLIASIFQEHYTKKQQNGFSQDQIELIVNQVLESENFQNQIKKLNFLSLKDINMECTIDFRERKDNMRKFIGIFGNTILLVMEEYFRNRYSKQEQLEENMKRPLNFMDISNDEYSQDQYEIYFCGKKKNKSD